MGTAEAWRLRGGVALITGAAGGIGAALAERLAGAGMHLALADRDAQRLGATARSLAARTCAGSLRMTTHVLDVADREAVAALPEAVQSAHGRLTVLVNNAGVALGGTFEQVDAADFDWLMDINFGGTVRMTRAFLPLLQAQAAAQVVNVSSIFGIIAPPGQAAYSASKFAVRGFSEALRHELQAAGSGVGVTLVHPGGVRTDIAAHARLARGLEPGEVSRHRAAWDKLLALPAPKAADRIARAIARREPRVLVGSDALAAAWLQRIFPVSYWRHAARDIARRAR